MILKDIEKYIETNNISKPMLAKNLSIPENSVREVFKRPQSNQAKVIDWYLEKVEQEYTLPKAKKHLMIREIESVVCKALRGATVFSQVEDLKKYISQL